VLGFSLGVAGDCYMACVTMELAIKCYFRALELEGTKDISLEKSLANVENKLGVFYMNQATALVQKINDNQELAVTAMAGWAGAQDLFNYSRMYLNQCIAKFESISDLANTAFILSYSGCLSRLAMLLACRLDRMVVEPSMVERKQLTIKLLWSIITRLW
jgi:hypothetical protein